MKTWGKSSAGCHHRTMVNLNRKPEPELQARAEQAAQTTFSVLILTMLTSLLHLPFISILKNHVKNIAKTKCVYLFSKIFSQS